MLGMTQYAGPPSGRLLQIKDAVETMDNTFLVSLSRLSGLRRQMDIIANNIANANTDGFKSEQPLFEEYISPNASGENTSPDIIFSMDTGVTRNMQQGNILRTGSPLDTALGIDGFFSVQRDGGVAYTRNGNFKLSSKGELVTSDGLKILDSQSNPIVLPSNSGMPEIAKDGTISLSGQTLQRLGVFKMESPAAMQNIGGNLYTTDEKPSPLPARDVTIIQGSVEMSNVESITEMTRMIDVLRKYQTASQLIDTGDDMLRKAIDQLSRIR